MKLTWIQNDEQLTGKRVATAYDGVERYFAEIPADATEDGVAAAFFATYDGDLDGDNLSVEIFEAYDRETAFAGR